MFCKSCGVNLGNKQPKFCPACGGEYPTQLVRPTAPPTKAAATGRGRRLLWAALLSTGLMATGGAIYWGFSSAASPVDVNQSFTLDYPSDAKNLDVFLEGDSFATISQGGPYYLGVKLEQQQPILAAFRQLKEAKVAEAAKLTREIFEQEGLLLEDVLLLQEALFEFWDVLQANDPDLRRQGGDLAALLLADRVKLEGLLAVYKALPAEGNEMLKARNAYRRSVLAIELAGAQTRALARLTAVALPLSSTYEKSSTPQLKDACRQFEDRLERMAAAGGRLDEIQSRIALLSGVLRQIDTGEHYMGLASLEYARKLTPTIQANLKLIATNGRASGADLDFMQENLKYQERVFSGLEKSLRAVPAANLVSPAELDQVKISQAFSLVLSAHAAENSAWERSIQALSMGAADTRKQVSSKLAGGWQSIKTTYQDAKGAVGLGMDGVNTAVKSGFDYAIGKWEGNSDKDIRDTVLENFAKMERNLVTGESGADVFESAEDYFNALEDGGGDFAGAGARTVFGEGNVSWLAGHVGKITVNMFTGFGKGIAKIANTRATGGEVAEGYLDVGLSFIGGSKAIGKASQLLAGGKSGVKSLGKKGLNFLERVAKNADLGKLKDVGASLLSKKKLTPGDIKKLISNAGKIEADEALKQSLLAVNEAVNKEFMDLIAKAGATLKSNATAGVKQSYKEFTREVFKESLQGYKDALLKVLGDGFSEYIDNLVANKADDMFKVMVKEYVDRDLVESGKGQTAQGKGNCVIDGVVHDFNYCVQHGSEDAEPAEAGDCGIFCDEESKQRFRQGVQKGALEAIDTIQKRQAEQIQRGADKVMREQGSVSNQ